MFVCVCVCVCVCVGVCVCGEGRRLIELSFRRLLLLLGGGNLSIDLVDTALGDQNKFFPHVINC